MDNIYNKCLETAEFIKSKVDVSDAIGIVLGSGLGDFANNLVNPISFNYKDIPHFPLSTVTGHQGKLIFGYINNKKVLCFSGRWHLYEGYEPSEITLYIRVLKLLNVKCLILTNAAGGVNVNFKIPCLMVIDDYINFTGTNPLVGKNIDEFGPRFPDMCNAFSKELRSIADKAAQKINIHIEHGVYMGFIGPSYESPAEIRFARTCGADAVGMSTVHEAIVARHCDLPVLAISCITNKAAGMEIGGINHNDVQVNAQKASNDFKNIILEIVDNL